MGFNALQKVLILKLN